MGGSESIEEVLGPEFCADKKFFQFHNPDNICYANSLFQCFFNSPAVVSFILEFSSAMAKYPFNDIFENTPLGRMCSLYLRVYKVDQVSVDVGLGRVMGSVRNLTDQFPQGTQCDVHELLLFLFNSFDSTIDRVNELIGNSEVPYFTNIFRSEVTTLIQCGCGKTTTQTDGYLYIPLAISDLDVAASVEQFLKPNRQQENGFVCHKDLEYSAVRQFSKLPSMLVIHLGRFCQTQTGKFKKIMTHVVINRTLKLPDEGRIVKYKLKSAIVHCGRGIYEGHYVTIYNIGPYWVLANDDKLTAIDRNQMKQFLLNGRMPSSLECPTVYLLFYEICLTD